MRSGCRRRRPAGLRGSRSIGSGGDPGGRLEIANSDNGRTATPRVLAPIGECDVMAMWAGEQG
jgi:hypothetical protein